MDDSEFVDLLNALWKDFRSCGGTITYGTVREVDYVITLSVGFESQIVVFPIEPGDEQFLGLLLRVNEAINLLVDDRGDSETPHLPSSQD